ncbi:PREDICTED: isocitrate dehydrogenase [NAD] subunit gamma, mitochondrial [Gekko japonicus]|uniref:Isocitrate dehydrogenase [NAD] subunit gamma, mitochondrial n=1 Tax=Gekko japonicus TaxID=146911 RepID=A0ABM1JHW9_GEKJA|nr:PREDICTED: isocitrate dehydrogenase [NAD] subunit gamma, mitochondrial [Gekko japonicus]
MAVSASLRTAGRPIWKAALLAPRMVQTLTDVNRRNVTSQQQNIPPPAKYGGRHTVTMIPGDGIGPELMLHVKEIFRHACVPVDFEEVLVSSEASDRDLENAIMAIRRNRVALKGNLETNHNLPPSHKSRNHILRTTLDLFANVIHCKSLPGVATRHRDIDILVVRENTEGEYSNLEHESVSGVVESLKIITKTKSLRIAEYAFQLAKEAGRKKVTAVHKANIMRLANTGKSIATKNVANPTAMLLASCMMLDHLKLHSYASVIRKAVLASLDDSKPHTPDIGGQGTTSEAVQSILKQIRGSAVNLAQVPS